MLYVECAPDGTLFLDDDVRSRFGERFVVVETPDGLLLVPAIDDREQDARAVLKAMARWEGANDNQDRRGPASA